MDERRPRVFPKERKPLTDKQRAIYRRMDALACSRRASQIMECDDPHKAVTNILIELEATRQDLLDAKRRADRAEFQHAQAMKRRDAKPRMHEVFRDML